MLLHGNDSKIAQIYSYLIQAGLFSESGITAVELMKLLDVSRATVDGRIKKACESGLVKIQIHNKLNYYSLDIDKLDEFLSRNS